MILFNDFNTTMEKALTEIDPNWREYEGIVICGTHSPQNPEQQIEEIRNARENGIPLLGICFGYQLAAIEYARNILGVKDATSEEFGKGTLVVRKRPELKVGLHEGESWWSNYEVVIRVDFPRNFFCVPFHPEYQSSKEKPHPVLISFLEYAKRMAS